jgi:hypothetical protein
VVPLLFLAYFLTQNSVIYLEKQSHAMLREVAVRVGNEIRLYIENHTKDLTLIHKLYAFELITPE